MVFLGVTITSCAMRRPCSAYGESKYYQIEKPFNWLDTNKKKEHQFDALFRFMSVLD